MPVGFDRFGEALRCGVEVYQALRGIVGGRGLSTNVGDEGGFAPQLPSNEAALELLVEAVRAAGYEPGKDCLLALDAAATALSRSRIPRPISFPVQVGCGAGKWKPLYSSPGTRSPFFM